MQFKWHDGMFVVKLNDLHDSQKLKPMLFTFIIFFKHSNNLK